MVRDDTVSWRWRRSPREREGAANRFAKIIAWSGVYVVLWQLNAVGPSPEWVVHSTIVASAGISSLDYQTGESQAAAALMSRNGRVGYDSWSRAVAC